MNCTNQDLIFEIGRVKANGLYDLMAKAADEYGVQLSFVLAVASRETNMVHEIGDGGHGVGILQLDTQHTLAANLEASGQWDTLQGKVQLIDACVAMLAADQVWAETTYPQFIGPDKDGARKIASSSYNAGRGNAAAGIREYGDSDHFTTGMDYGLDVVERMHVLETLLA